MMAEAAYAWPRVPQKLTREGVELADIVVPMGCDECPHIPSTRYIDWDPAGPHEPPHRGGPGDARRLERRGDELLAELAA